MANQVSARDVFKPQTLSFYGAGRLQKFIDQVVDEIDALVNPSHQTKAQALYRAAASVWPKFSPESLAALIRDLGDEVAMYNSRTSVPMFCIGGRAKHIVREKLHNG